MADNDFLQAFSQGVNLAESGFQRDLQRRQLAGQEADRALRARVAMQEMELNAQRLKIAGDEAATKAKVAAQRDAAFQNYLRDVQSGSDQGEAILKNMVPLSALEQGGIDDALRGVINHQREKLEGPLRREGMEAETTLRRAQTAQALSASTRSANLPASLQEAEAITSLQNQLDATTDPMQRAALQRKLTNIQAQTMSAGTTVFDPATGNPIVQIGGRSSSTGAPNSVVAKATERITKDIKMMEELASVERTLRPQDVGVQGVLGEEIVDRLLPQFGVKVADAQRADNRTKLKMAIEGAMKQVSDDTRFSNADRTAIKAVLPRAGMVESFENAVKTSQVLRRIIAKRALIDAKEVGRTPPVEAIRNLDPEGIRDAYRSGLISEDQAINALAK